MACVAALSTAIAPALASAQWKKEEVKGATAGESYSRFTLSSATPLKLSPPHDGNNRAHLAVRPGNFPGGAQLSLLVDQGQFDCPVGPDFCEVVFRFDNQPPIALPAVRPADGSGHRLFLREDGRFMAGASKAATITVQVAFVPDGARTLTFASPGGIEGSQAGE
jgi:hypothetical protein